jgi:hypothetical protein
MKKFVSLGTECVEFLKAAQASRGELFYVVSSACLMCLSMVSYSPFLSLFRNADALTVTNARIASLEAERNASRKAWDTATATKVAAEKFAMSVAAKAKKAEKALVDADQGRVQREQAITKRLIQISTLAGGKYRVVLFLSICSFFYLLMFSHYLLSLSFVFLQSMLEYLWRLCSRMMKTL